MDACTRRETNVYIIVLSEKKKKTFFLSRPSPGLHSSLRHRRFHSVVHPFLRRRRNGRMLLLHKNARQQKKNDLKPTP